MTTRPITENIKNPVRILLSKDINELMNYFEELGIKKDEDLE